MYGNNFRAPKVDVHQFSMIPRAEIPRSQFKMQHQHKTTLDAAKLYPIYVQEILPGDSFAVNMTAFCRLQTTIYPVMDNMDIETWFFFVPNRIIWNHWVNFMGEQPSGPADSISYTIPQVVSPTNGFAAFSIYDYMGVPCAGQVGAGNTISVNALPFRAYNKIFNEWFRDENLVNSSGYGAANTVYDIGDGPDPYTNYTILQPAKRHDYFTSCLPWTQKGAAGAVTLPLGTSANIKTNATNVLSGAGQPMLFLQTSGSAPTGGPNYLGLNASEQLVSGSSTSGGAFVPAQNLYPSNLYADLSTATAATINQLRLAFQTQRLLERDARGGTRYTEIIRSHFGVQSPDARLQRPEYIGGGKTPVNITPVAQTTATGLTGGTSPLGTLAGVGTAVARSHGFRGSFTEHGHIIGIAAIRSDQVYQQGLRRMWTRSTRYDFYFPVFSMLGEQGVRNDEIYCVGTPAQDTSIFGYNERWAEYRYFPSQVTAAFRSTYSTPLDAWHLSYKYTALPALNATFITDPTNTVLTRALAAGAAANNEQFLVDLFFDTKCARPMPMYSVPGLIDHF